MRTGMFRGALMGMFASVVVMGAALAPRADAGARIVGGTNAPTGSWPAIAAITHAAVDLNDPPDGVDNLDTYCGGTLIHPEWVLTAAHCVAAPRGLAADLRVVLGMTSVAEPYAPRTVSQVVVHPGFVDNESYVNDVALLRLANAVTPTATIAPMDLVSPIRPDLWDGGSPAEIAGWGVQGNGLLATVLQQVSLPMASDATCTSAMGTPPPPPDPQTVFQSNSMVCAGDLAGGRDACQGDSGGPLTVLDSGVRKLVGAVSWGVGCAEPGLLGVYTRLDAYRGFIFGATGLNLLAPGTPTGVSAVAGVASATVSWTPPSTNGGRAIQTYGVRVIQDGISGQLVPVAGGQVQTTITGLTPGSNYTFTVLAATDVGLSPPSPATSTVVPVPPAPVVTVAPMIAGEARRGETLTASAGSWSHLGTTAIAWERCDAAGANCADVGGATTSTLMLTAAEVGARLRVRVTAGNTSGVTIAHSPLTSAVVPPPPAATVVPAIAGVARVGRTMEATSGTWSEAGELQVTWQACDASGAACADIPGAVGARFAPARDHVGRRLRARVTAGNAGGASQAHSPVTAIVRGAFRILVTHPQRVTHLRSGVVRIMTTVRSEPGARVVVQVRDSRGVLRRLQRGQSRVNGRVPRAAAGGLGFVAVAPGSGVVTLTIVLSGRPAAAATRSRLEVVATDTAGERSVVVKPFRARL